MKTILDFLKKDWGVKLVILMAVIGLWFYVSIGQVRTGTFPGAVKIEPRSVPTGMAAILSNDYAELVLSAQKNVWESLQPDSLNVFVDLSNLGEGTHEVTIQATTNNQDVDVVSVSPKTVFVSIEPIITRELPVTVVIEGEPAADHIVGGYSVNPESVTLTGARSVVAGIDQVTANIILDNESESFQKEVKLQAANIRENITFSPVTATVSVQIVTSSESKTAGIKPVVTGNPQDGYYVSAITVTPATVNISGNPELLTGINTISTSSIDVSGADRDITQTVTLDLPSNISSSLTEVRVKVTISKISTP